MKYYVLIGVCCLLSILSLAQDSTKQKASYAGIRFSGVPMEKIAEADTTYQNGLSISPIIDLRTARGWGISYSPSILISGEHPGIYMHAFSGGYERYGKSSFDLAFDYTHYLFTHNTNVPYSAISNEVFIYAAYSKPWLQPQFAMSFGFGKDSSSGSAHEIAIVTGVSHDIEFDDVWKFTAIDIAPALLLNAGTNGHFSFLQVSKYISNSHHFTSYVKKGKKEKSSNPSMQLSNLEWNLDADLEMGAFSIHPTGSLFLPVGPASSDAGVYGYAEISLHYSF